MKKHIFLGIGIPVLCLALLTGAYFSLGQFSVSKDVTSNSFSGTFCELYDLAADFAELEQSALNGETVGVSVIGNEVFQSEKTNKNLGFCIDGNFSKNENTVYSQLTFPDEMTGIILGIDTGKDDVAFNLVKKDSETTTDKTDSTGYYVKLDNLAKQLDTSILNPDVNPDSPLSEEQYTTLRSVLEKLEVYLKNENETTDDNVERVINEIVTECKKCITYKSSPVYFKTFLPGKHVSIKIDDDSLRKMLDIFENEYSDTDNQAFTQWCDNIAKGFNTTDEKITNATELLAELKKVTDSLKFSIEQSAYIENNRFSDFQIKIEIDTTNVPPDCWNNIAFPYEIPEKMVIEAEYSFDYGKSEGFFAEMLGKITDASHTHVGLTLNMSVDYPESTEQKGEIGDTIASDSTSIEEKTKLKNTTTVWDFYAANQEDGSRKFTFSLKITPADENVIYWSAEAFYNPENGGLEIKAYKDQFLINANIRVDKQDGNLKNICISDISLEFDALKKYYDINNGLSSVVERVKLEDFLSIKIGTKNESVQRINRDIDFFAMKKEDLDVFINPETGIVSDITKFISEIQSARQDADVLTTVDGLELKPSADWTKKAQSLTTKYTNYLQSVGLDERNGIVFLNDEKTNIWSVLIYNAETNQIATYFYGNLPEEIVATGHIATETSYSLAVHNWQYGEKHEATCTTYGYQDATCTICGIPGIYYFANPLKHQYEKKSGKLTVHETGKKITVTFSNCKNCNTVYKIVTPTTSFYFNSDGNGHAILSKVQVDLKMKAEECLEIPAYADYKGEVAVIGIADNAFDSYYDGVSGMAPYMNYKTYSVRMEEGLLTIGNGAFSKLTDLAVVILPSTLISIGEKSFNPEGSEKVKVCYCGTNTAWAQVNCSDWGISNYELVTDFDRSPVRSYFKTNFEKNESIINNSLQGK